MTDQDIDLNMPLAAEIPIASATLIPSSKMALDRVHASFATSHTLNRDQILTLQQQGFPMGLAQELGNTKSTYPLRFWVVDNSGSMRTSDGHQLRGSHENLRIVDCTRWTELQGAVEYHAELAGSIQATTVFRLLNDPGVKAGNQEFSVAETNSASIQEDVERAKSIISKTEPKGVTPLTEHLMEIRRRIESVEPLLRQNGQQAVIVLATDGLPSNQMGESPPAVQDAFIDALRSLQTLPVWVVVRLCTDNDDVVSYYNNLDQILELPLEVIDDFFGEAKEIQSANKWLNYTLPLHRCREMGYHHRVFDLLDERLLNKDELRVFVELLFGKAAMQDAPDPHADWNGFKDVLSRVVKSEGKHYNPTTRKVDFWIDFNQLDKAYGKGGFRLFSKRR